MTAPKPSDAARKPARKRLTAHQKIVRAANRGTGVRLSADDVWSLSMDDAIQQVAANDDEDDAP